MSLNNCNIKNYKQFYCTLKYPKLTTYDEKVEEGVRLFDPEFHTGLLTDWSQDGFGHILCQKHCDCPLSEGQPADLNCCKTGWKVCSVGSRFCNSAEANYSPTDGEFTGLVDTLEKTAHFTLGCKSLTVGTDH